MSKYRSIVKIGYETQGGGFLPLATTRDVRIARLVARQVLAETEQVKPSGDEVLDEMATGVRETLRRQLERLDLVKGRSTS